MGVGSRVGVGTRALQTDYSAGCLQFYGAPLIAYRMVGRIESFSIGNPTRMVGQDKLLLEW